MARLKGERTREVKDATKVFDLSGCKAEGGISQVGDGWGRAGVGRDGEEDSH